MIGEVEVAGTKCSFLYDARHRFNHAPHFDVRVVHHALMRRVEPVLERAHVADTYACRKGKGSLAAVLRVQELTRRYPWYVQIDIRKYFDSIDHYRVMELLEHRIKGSDVLSLLDRIVRCHEAAPGKGLPIGALTSQHLANAYLAPLDRFLAADMRCAAAVRYMDDVVVFCRYPFDARSILARMKEFLAERLFLQVKPSSVIQRTTHGVAFCGFRALPGSLRLSRRRRRRFTAARLRWESLRAAGQISDRDFRGGIAAAYSVVAHADADGWLRENHIRLPAADL